MQEPERPVIELKAIAPLNKRPRRGLAGEDGASRSAPSARGKVHTERRGYPAETGSLVVGRNM
jgi:hypothetical protein